MPFQSPSREGTVWFPDVKVQDPKQKEGTVIMGRTLWPAVESEQSRQSLHGRRSLSLAEGSRNLVEGKDHIRAQIGQQSQNSIAQAVCFEELVK